MFKLLDQLFTKETFTLASTSDHPNPSSTALRMAFSLASANLLLGILSNAQFYTPLLFPALMEQTLEELAFSSEMQYYSYQYGRAKPDEFLFREAVAGLDRKGIDPSESLYVGNDMLNDIMPAAKNGFSNGPFCGGSSQPPSSRR